MGKGVAPIQMAKGRVVIVTGANSGIGYEIAKGIAMRGATVIVACRSEERATTAIAKMKEEFEAIKKKGNGELTDSLDLEFMKLDLGSMQSTVDFADKFKKSGRKLHVLFCNAGMGMQPFAKTADGHERTLQVNYLGHFVLVAKLLPIMLQSGPDCRILMMSSSAHKMGMCHYDYNSIEYTGPAKDFPSMDYYGRSKMYQIMQIYCLVRRLAGSNITVTCFCPGATKTEFGQDVELKGCMEKCMWCCVKTVGKTPEKAAKLCIDCSVDKKYEGVTGMYYESGKRSMASDKARDEKNQEAVWNKSLELVGQHITAEEKAAMEGQTLKH